MKTLRNYLILLFGALCLFSCGKSSQTSHYLAVKLVDSNLWSIVNTETGKIVYEDEFTNAPMINGDVIILQNDDKTYDLYSIKNVKKPLNDEPLLGVTPFNENGLALATIKGRPIVIINKFGKEVGEFPEDVKKGMGFSEGLARVMSVDGNMGYVDEKGHVAIDFSYDAIGEFSQYAMTYKSEGDHYVVSAIDRSGKEMFTVSSSIYDAFGSFFNGYIAANTPEGETVLLNKKGEKVLKLGQFEDDELREIKVSGGIVPFKQGELYGLKKLNGDTVLRAKYERLISLAPESSKLFIAYKGGKFGIVDKNDKIIRSFEDENIRPFEDFVVVKRGNTYYLTDLNGKEIGRETFEDVSFSVGLNHVFSNYFYAKGVAHNCIKNISDTSFFGISYGNTLKDYKSLLKGKGAKNYLNVSLLEDGNISYEFDDNLAYSVSRSSWFSYYTDYEFRYSARLVRLYWHKDVTKYAEGSEEKFVEEFENQIQEIGFKPTEDNPKVFENEAFGNMVSVGYDKGIITVCYSFTHYMPELERNTRINND